MSAAHAMAIEANVAAAVDVRGLAKVIDDRVILDQITFDVPAGSYVALLGANGAGKSTLLKILATLVRPTRGDVRMFGHALGPSLQARARLGLIGHATMLYRDLSARENLVFFGRLYGVSEPRRRADELLDYVGLSVRASDPVHTYSRGMAQRAAIARALVHDPDLLLADEPFTGLDAPSREMLEKMLARLHAEGKTIILANHDIEQSLSLTRRALVLRGGRLVLDAPTPQLSASGVLAVVSP